jgi:membrane protein YqaA with SNARE-associated domain
MKRLAAWIKAYAVVWGGPGLFVIGYLDSSFLSFPEVNDLLVMGMVMRHHALLTYYSLMATLGSLAGCLTLYYIAKAGGEAFVRKRFRARHVDRALALSQKYGLLIVMVPALLPPPVPFKIFILIAGVAEIPLWQFTIGVFAARFVRYFGEGLLAVWYGNAAFAFLKANAGRMGLALSVAVLVIGALVVVLRRRKAQGNDAIS